MRPSTLRAVLMTALAAALLSCVAPHRAAPAAESTVRMSRAIHWVRNSAEFRAATRQAYRLATARLEQLVAGRARGTWAVSLDGDETIFDNSLYQKEREALGLDYTIDTWNEWCARRQAGIVPGAREFMQRVRELGGVIAVVTNRLTVVQQHSEANLKSLDVPFDVVLSKDDTSQKEPRWKRLTDGTAAPDLPPLEIVMWVGDNVGDFPDLDQSLREGSADAYDGFGDRYWVLPNPMYGSWVGNPTD